jgi:hypothetical protein
MKIKLLFIAIAVCMIATPVKADLFGFHLGNLSTSFDGGTGLTTTDWLQTSGSLYRNVAPSGTAVFSPGSFGTVGSESLLISMTLSNITALTADATGTISFSDIHGDTISGNISGTWIKAGTPSFPQGIFSGTLTSVTHIPANATFDGHSGSVSLVYPQNPQPWNGAIVQLTSANWFSNSAYSGVKGGSIDVSVVPVPTAFVLGVLGLGVAGLKLRKFA